MDIDIYIYIYGHVYFVWLPNWGYQIPTGWFCKIIYIYIYIMCIWQCPINVYTIRPIKVRWIARRAKLPQKSVLNPVGHISGQT